MSWKALKRVRKKYKSNYFNFVWVVFVFILLFWLFKLDGRTPIIIDKSYAVPELSITISNSDNLNQELNSILNQIRNEHNNLKKEIEASSKLEAKFESLDKAIDMISNYIGLFGVLITVISIFFSLRESSRIDEYIEKYEDEIERYQNELNSLDNKIRSHFDSRKKELEKQINTMVIRKLDSFQKNFDKNSNNFNPPQGGINNTGTNKANSYLKSQKNKGK